MPLKFPLRIRFFTNSFPVTHLSYNPSIRIFSSTLNYFAFGSCINFSTRPSRDLPEFERRSQDGGQIRSSKSLIEDEEELSNWLSGFRTGSSRDDDDSGSNVEDRGRGRNQDRRGIRNQVDSFRDKQRYGGSGLNGRIQGKSSEVSFRGRKETSFRRDRGREDYKGLKKREDRLLEDESSDEDVKSLIMGDIGNLLSEEDEEEDQDYEFLKKKAASAFGFDKEKLLREADKARNVVDVTTSDSYLTKTR